MKDAERKCSQSLVGDLNLVLLELRENMSWYTGRSVEGNGIRKPVMEYPDIRPLESAQAGRSQPRLKKRRPQERPPSPERQPIRLPDFQRLIRDGAEILDHGLPELPQTLDYSQSVPLAYWKGEGLGTVLFL